jgi:hypothetical protein
VSAILAWWAYVLRYEAREMWRALPGPWWAKVLLLVALSAIPGQLDEVVFLAVLSAFRKRKARRAPNGN